MLGAAHGVSIGPSGKILPARKKVRAGDVMWKVRAVRCRREDAVARARRVTSSRCFELRRTTESSAPTAWDVCRRPRFLSLSCLIKRTSSSSAISVAQRARAGSRLGFNRANHCTFFRLTWLSGSSEVAGQGSRLLTAIFFLVFLVLCHRRSNEAVPSIGRRTRAPSPIARRCGHSFAVQRWPSS